jgi:hypothetical protein
MDRTRLEYWPAQLQSVFAVIGKSMGDKRLMPDMARGVPTTRGAVVAGHEVQIAYVLGKRTGPRCGHYVVTVLGPKISACWKFRPTELEKLSRSVSRALGESRDLRFDQGVECW